MVPMSRVTAGVRDTDRISLFVALNGTTLATRTDCRRRVVSPHTIGCSRSGWVLRLRCVACERSCSRVGSLRSN